MKVTRKRKAHLDGEWKFVINIPDDLPSALLVLLKFIDAVTGFTSLPSLRVSVSEFVVSVFSDLSIHLHTHAFNGLTFVFSSRQSLQFN